VSIDIESITSVTGSISSVILAGTAGWKIWNDNIKKPRLELEIEKSRVVEKADGAFDFQINLTLSCSKSKFYLKEVFLLGKPSLFFLPDTPLKIILNLFPSYLHKLQLNQGIICRREDPFKVWNTNLIDFCNQPVLGKCSFDKFAENYGKDVKDIEIEEGVKQIETGEYVEYNEESLIALGKDIKARGRKRKQAQDGDA